MIPIDMQNSNRSAEKTPGTIGQMVAADYRKAVVFRKYGLDYCCGGKKTLEEACLKKGLDPALVQRELEELDREAPAALADFDSWPLDRLVGHIVDRHHRYVDDALPMLTELTLKVARVHGEKHPELIRIAQKFDQVANELYMHLRKEESILFPYVNRLTFAFNAGIAPTAPFFGSVMNPIRMMEVEHESAGGEMEEIRKLSDDYTPPLDACTSYRVLFAKLQEFEQDLHQHIHLENNILFPKAVALEKTLFAA